MKRHLTFANVCSATALFLVVAGGTATAVSNLKLGKNAVKSRHIAPGQVKASDLGRGAVIGSKLRARSVTSDKLAPGVLGGQALGPLSVGTAELMPGSVTSDKLAAGAVIASKIAANAVDASKIPDDQAGNDNVNASQLGGLPSSLYQLGDGVDQVTQGFGLESGDLTSPTEIISGTFRLKCAATPSLEFQDRGGEGFVTDAWDPEHSTVADGGSKSFTLPADGIKMIQIFGLGGDLITVSSYVEGGDCVMIAHSTSNFGHFAPAAASGAGATQKGGRARSALFR